jgi:ribosome modulation factor
MNTVTPSPSPNQEPTSSRRKPSAKEERVNSALREALFMHEDSQNRWDKLIADGAHDTQIWHGLLREFGTGGGSQTVDGTLFAYIGGGNGIDPPLFWVGTSNHRTQDKPTLKGAALVKRVRELLQIPAMKALDDTAESGEAEETSPAQSYGAHEFTPKSDDKNICALCFQGRRGKPHRAWKEAQAQAQAATLAESGEAVPETHEDSPYADETEPAALLAKTEEEQRARFAALTLLDETLTTDPPARKREKLEKERDELRAVYDSTYAEAASAFGVEAAEQMRARVEYPAEILIGLLSFIDVDVDAATVESWTLEQRAQVQEYAAAVHLSASDNDDVIVPPRPDFLPVAGITSDDVGNGDCGPDCQHTGEEHAAFDAGVQAGGRGDDESACPFDSDYERDAWLSGHAIGEANALIGKTPATEIAYAPTRRFTRELECELSDSDLLAKLTELTTKLTQKDAVEQELKEVSAGYKGRIKTLDREVHQLTRVVTKRCEEREVECEERFNYAARQAQIVRLDTFDVVESRAMTQRETQQYLFAPSI